MEIEYLSEVEKKQRNQKKPEFMRLLDVVFDSFMVINLGYSVLTIVAIVKFLNLKRLCQRHENIYPVWPNLSADFYAIANDARLSMIANFMDDLAVICSKQENYCVYISLSILFAFLKLFEFFEKSANMRAMLMVIKSIGTDLVNFLIIFFVMLFAFITLAHIAFGTQVLQFATLHSAFANLFELTLTNSFKFSFLNHSVRINMFLTSLFFIGGTFIFVFIFSNIFLSIMMNSYQQNIG
jgi:hypothetical protein